MAQPQSDAERSPGMAVEEAAARLDRCGRKIDVSPQHDSRCVLNAAGTDETMETSHKVVAHVPHDRVEDFERAAREVAETFSIKIAKRDDRGRGGRKRFILRP